MVGAKKSVEFLPLVKFSKIHVKLRFTCRPPSLSLSWYLLRRKRRINCFCTIWVRNHSFTTPRPTRLFHLIVTQFEPAATPSLEGIQETTKTFRTPAPRHSFRSEQGRKNEEDAVNVDDGDDPLQHTEMKSPTLVNTGTHLKYPRTFFVIPEKIIIRF